MKSFVRTIIVLAVFGLVMASPALAQGGAGEAHVEAGTETIGATVTMPSAAPPSPPSSPPPRLSVMPVSAEVVNEVPAGVTPLGRIEGSAIVNLIFVPGFPP